MTTQDLGRDLGQGLGPQPAAGRAVDEDGLGALFDSSPARPVHTSAAAEIAFVAGSVSVLAAPFPLMLAVSLGLSVVGLVSSVVGLARSSRRGVAGSLLASIGLVLSLATLALLGLRYLGIDTAFGPATVPTLVDWLTALNDLLPPTLRAPPMTEKFATVEAYLDSLEPEARSALEEIRATIHAALPGAEDTISYNMPTLVLDGRRVVHYAGWKNHVSLYPAPDDPALEREIAPYSTGRGTLKFPLGQPVPRELVARIVQSLSAGSR